MVKITPILQTLLMSQLAVVVDNMNTVAYYKAWCGLKTLISISPDSVKSKMQGQIQVVQREIDAVASDRQQDISQQRTTQTKRINLICVRSVPKLLEDTMAALYAGGYLEFGRKEEGGFA